MLTAAPMDALSSLLATIQKLYPQARVTSGYRGPDNPLYSKNPKSLHNLGSPDDPRAVDVAPIPGVSFGDYVNNIKGAGVPVSQAFDEATHPFPWTTGPNWHIGEGSPQVAAPQRKKTLADVSSPLLNQQPDINVLPDSIPAPQTLADVSLPQMAPVKKSPFTLGNIAGVLGDALMAYGGMQPQFGPELARQQEDNKTLAYDREKLNNELEIARQKALEPPQFVQNLQAYLAMTPEQKRSLLQYQDATNPINVSTPQGTQNVPRTQTKTIGGKTYYNIGGEWYEESE